ncbi:MAG TPA: VCBS repeat-containing protein, partial [Terriglobales bacterium]
MNTLPISSRVRAAAILLPALMMVMTVSLGARARKGHVSTPAGKGKAPQSYQGGPKIWLQDRQTLQVAHVGADGTAQNKSAAQSLAAGQGQPLAMIHGDFDQDGIEDLAVGYATPGGGAIVVHRGNLDAFAPQSDASFQAIGRGEFPAPFLPQAKVFSIPIRPDFLAAGNFTGKGNTDLVAASKGGNALYVFPGDGKGNFGQPQIFSLSGAVHALAAGNLGNGQSFTNIVVGIANSQKSFSLLVLGGTGVGFGALASYPLSGPASNIVFGDLDGDARPDMAILAGGQVLIYHGASGQLGPVSLPFSVQALALGSFVFDRDSREQMALLTSDGTVHVAAHSSFDPRAFTLNEWQTMRQATVNGLPNPVVPPPVAGESWTIVESFASVAPFSAGQPPVLFRTRISGNSADDVMVLNGFSGQMAVISHPNLKNGAATFAPGEVSTRNYSGSPVAALPMRINVDGRPGVVVLHQGQTAPAVMGPLPDPTYVVDDFTDEIVAGACGSPGPVVPGKCSLREAINEANATAGVDTITLPAGTFTLTITNATANGENNNATGDLDIKDGLNIIGAVDVGGNPATIIQAGPSAGTGIDKVFSVNPLFTTAFDTSFANLEIRFGKNLASFGTNGFGGGFDWEASHTGTMTVTNCNIHDNTIADGSGGGITATNTGGGTGQFTISSSTVSSNVAARPSGNTARGGGIFFGSATRFTITNTHIDNNQAITSNGEGGGIFVFNPGTTPISVIHGGSFTGNQSVVRGGGIRSTAGITIDQGTVISNNTSATGAGLWSNLQTSVPFPSGETTTLTKVTITGNTATTSGGGIQSDNSTPGNNLVISLSRLAGNTSPSGSNLFTPNPGGAVTATNNWWGTNAASSTIGGGATVNCPTPGQGQICFDPFIVLTHTANPAKILINQSSTLTGDMSNDNHGNAVGLSNLTEIIGLPITFDNPVLGTIPEAQPETLDANAQATATFNAGGTGGRGSAHATVDQAVVSANSNLIASATESGTTVTITTVGTHNFASGETVVISGVGVGGYNGTFTIATVTPPTQFTYTDGNSGLGASSGGTANVGIIILQPPSMTKSFSPKTVSTNTDSTLTFSIDNSVNVVPINASFTDTLPGAVRVGPTPGVTNTCGGTFTPAAGDTSISFTNASLAVGTCTITVKVQSPSDGVFNNSVTLDSSDAGNATSAATDTLTVINPPHIVKAFGATTIPLNGTTSLTFTIDSNSNQNLTLTGVAFTDNLPAGLVVATPGNLNSTCSGTATAADGSSSVSLSGASVAPNSSCTVSVTVQGTTAGVKSNSVTPTSTNGGTGATSNANITVVGPPTISKTFNPTSIALNATSTLSFTITNPNTASALSGVAFTDNLPAGVVVAATP